MKASLLFIGTVVLGFVITFAQAAALSKLWAWFVAPQYGAGPRYATWYGIALIVGILTTRRTSDTRSSKADEKFGAVAYAALVGSLAVLFALALTLGVAWCTGQIFGWVP